MPIMFLVSIPHLILLPVLALAVSPAVRRLSEFRENSRQSCQPPSNSAFQNAVTTQVNSLRYSYQAKPLRWNAKLASSAAKCAADHVSSGTLTACNMCGSNAVETAGINGSPTPSQGARAILSASSNDFSREQVWAWFAAFNNPWGDGWPCIDWNSPAYNSSCSSFTQLIWQSTTQFGCAYSNTTSNSIPEAGGIDVHALSCCWWPAGNIPGLFHQNVLEDIE